MEQPTPSGQRFAIAFVDDATRYTTVMLMRTKDQALECFQEYARWMRTMGYPLEVGSTLQSDNDGVFRSHAFTKWCGDCGIAQQFSAPHTQQQNGVAERAWNTLVDTARSLLASSGLGKQFWGLALRHAANVRNLVPTSAKDAAVPFELLTGKPADISGLRKFGCPAFVHVERESRRKWDNKARRGVYVGFSLQSKTDLVYFANTNTIVESMHCDFDEDGQQPVVVVGEEGVNSNAATSAAGTSSASGVPITIDVLLPAYRHVAGQAMQPGSEEASVGDSDEPIQDEPVAPAVADMDNDNASNTSAASEQDDSVTDDFDPIMTDFGPPVAAPLSGDSGSEDDESGDPLLSLAHVMLVEALQTHASPAEPKTVKEALAGPNADHWQASLMEECRSILENKTWTLVPRNSLPAGARPPHGFQVHLQGQV